MGLAALTIVSSTVGLVALSWLLVVSIRLWREPHTPRYLRVALVMFILLEAIIWIGIVRRVLVEISRIGIGNEDFDAAIIGPIQDVMGFMALLFIVLVIFYGQQLRALVKRREAMVAVISDGSPLATRVSDIGLTPRELEVLLAIQDGHLSNDELADRLYVSSSTVASHVRNVMRKAGVSSRRELMLLITEERQDKAS